MKHLLYLFLVLFLLATVPGASVSAQPILVMDVYRNQVLDAHFQDTPWYPASLTKLMTAYVAFKAISESRMTVDTQVEISVRATKVPPSRLGLKAGQAIRLIDALAIMLTKSSNDVTRAIAETIANDETAFVNIMNKMAVEIGMKKTRFVNATGLPGKGQFTTARDMAILTRRILIEFPHYAWLFSQPSLNFEDQVLENSNPLVGRIPGITSSKTGYICSAGYNLVMSQQIGMHHIIVVVLGESSMESRALRALTLTTLAANQRLLSHIPQPYTLATLPYSSLYEDVMDYRPINCPTKKTSAAEIASLQGILERLADPNQQKSLELAATLAHLNVDLNAPLKDQPKIEIRTVLTPSFKKDSSIDVEEISSNIERLLYEYGKDWPPKRPNGYLGIGVEINGNFDIRLRPALPN